MKSEHALQEKHVDYIGAKMGMWLFLFTELLFFGGLFLLYAVYRSKFPQEFHATSAVLNTSFGAVNTFILITSSLTMALSMTAMKKGELPVSLNCQKVTILLGTAFLVLKYFEWNAKISHGIYPGSDLLQNYGQGEIIFYSLYFVMTGLHGLHVVAGVGVLVVIYVWSGKGKIHSGDFNKLENAGLYWHFVDIVWVYLFPLLYLIG
jgi:cytochrome c oxidase subunit 3